MPGKYYITTAIDYANSSPHIGTAYEKISADVFARFHRLIGDDVYFQMGNDEHSLNVLRSAKAKGEDPQAYADEMERVFLGVWEKLEVSFDRFVRTSERDHQVGVTKLLRAIEHDIYKGHYEGHYCESCEAFYQEKDLEDGKCPTHGTEPVWIQEENYFFRLSEYGDRLLEHIESHPEFIQPESRKNEIVQFIKGGLEDISVTRAGAEWGTPFPMDESQVVYVWFDALPNYITGAGFGYDEERFAKWWPADVHLIGKDITRFHCIFWPAMLLSAGVTLPKTVYGHGFVYLKGQKLSKSQGVVVDPLEAADVFGPCALRYYLMREGTYGRDVDFTWEQFRSRYDSELANDLGNLVSRATAMAGKFLGGTIERPADHTAAGDMPALAESTRAAATKALDTFAPQVALGAVWELVRRANAYIEEEKPWVLAKQNPERIPEVLFAVFEAIRQVAVLAWPVMPGKCEEILAALGLRLTPGELPLDELLAWGAGWPDTIVIEKPAAVFPKYTDEDLVAKFDMTGAGEAAAPAEKVKTGGEKKMLSFDQFKELELKLAKIESAEKVEGTTKLIKMSVDLGGGDVRSMVAGIAEGYQADELVGKTIVVVANLEPAKIRGIESQAMLLAAVGDGGIALVGPDKDLPPGTKVS